MGSIRTFRKYESLDPSGTPLGMELAKLDPNGASFRRYED
jgi:hypothetical protein